MATNTNNELLKYIGSYLKEISGLRFEWSLKISPTCIEPRLAPIFWITNYNNHDNSAQYKKLNALLFDLNCPEVILNTQNKLAPISKTQGLSISLEKGSNKKCVYIQFNEKFDNKPKRLGLKWDSKNFIEEDSYEFMLFSDSIIKHDLIKQIHPLHKELFLEVLSEPLISNSGYFTQKKGQDIRETYITYPWHPRFSNITDKLINHFPEINGADFHKYDAHYFRHIGFTTPSSVTPFVTVYFSARFKGDWPLDFESIQKIVKAESEILNEQLNNWDQVIKPVPNKEFM